MRWVIENDKYAMASLIISLNKDGFNCNKDENVYFFIIRMKNGYLLV